MLSSTGRGDVGSAMAQAFAREGAKVFLAGRTLSKLDAVARIISDLGGSAQTAQVDVLEEQAVEDFTDIVVKSVGSIDICVNVTNFAERGTVFRTPTILSHSDGVRGAICKFARCMGLQYRSGRRSVLHVWAAVMVLPRARDQRVSLPRLSTYSL